MSFKTSWWIEYLNGENRDSDGDRVEWNWDPENQLLRVATTITSGYGPTRVEERFLRLTEVKQSSDWVEVPD